MAERVQYFHFTLGPVQGFVAQARRTRDFWAGSFLLSWLSGVAMKATLAQGGEILFPKPEAEQLAWLGGPQSSPAPVQGGIPNRFMAKVPADFDGALLAATVRAAWMALAGLVWQKDFAKVCASEASAAIWRRQNLGFWEISWAKTADRQATDLLDRRKNWRSHFPADEPGSKCFLMEGWQEISGVIGASAADNRQRRDFWQNLRSNLEAGETDFAEGEQLCALAAVKRRFVRHFENFACSLLLGNRVLHLRGWKLPTNQPSVMYMAAVHWLEQVLQKAAGDAELRPILERMVQHGSLLVDKGEWNSRIACLQTAAKSFDREPASNAGKKLVALDGSVFFESTLLNELGAQQPGVAQDFLRDLKALSRASGVGMPTPFYAILLMDGDQLGAHMRDEANQKVIPLALAEFTRAAQDTVQANNGHLIYAGGDDVLAVLPLEDALRCAAALRDVYVACFSKHPAAGGAPLPTTLSGAVVFSHVKMPLGEVLRQAHQLLDDVAKDATGRDALAVRVLKPGGEHLTWAQPWAKARDAVSGQLLIETLVLQFRSAEENTPGLSSKFFYKARQRLRHLQHATAEDRKSSAAFLRADFIASASNRDLPKDSLNTLFEPLVEHCTRYVRHKTSENTFVELADSFNADGLMLTRFLAHKGVETR